MIIIVLVTNKDRLQPSLQRMVAASGGSSGLLYSTLLSALCWEVFCAFEERGEAILPGMIQQERCTCAYLVVLSLTHGL